jgi:glucan biosynthesis protein C
VIPNKTLPMTSDSSTTRDRLQAETKAGSRVLFIDNWRSAVIVLVILHHLAVTYGAGAPFYYVEPPSANDVVAYLLLLLFILINQSWFMGALFLVSGYFTAGSFDRKGTRNFLKDRLLRLGIPLIVFFFVLNPLAMIGRYQMPASLTGITSPLSWDKYPEMIGMGPMWFVAMLLIFDLGYAAWRGVTRKRSPMTVSSSLPRPLAIVAFVLLLALATYLIRIIVPLGKFVAGFPTLGYLPQYLSFFVLGIIASRGKWFESVSAREGKTGFIVAVVATIVLLPIAVTGLTPGLTAVLNMLGNGHWQSAIYAMWDSTVSVGLCLGVIVFFRRFLNLPRRLGSYMARHSYAVYIIHAPIIVFLAVLLKGVNLEHLVKFGLVAVIAVPLCFSVAYLIRRIPRATRIL